MDGNERGSRCGHLPQVQADRDDGMRQDPPRFSRFEQLLESLQDGELLVISEIFCHGLMSAVLTSGPGDLGHSSRIN
jgi:hypothetical protein